MLQHRPRGKLFASLRRRTSTRANAAIPVTIAHVPQMISKHDLQRILAHDSGGLDVFSLFLDMSVNSDNKRTYQVFLNQRKAQFDELDSERTHQPREAVGRVFQKVDEWLDRDYREENRGVVIYAELGGDWFEALQFPVVVANRLVIAERPAVAPLAQVLESYHHHGIVLLDRERVRILSIYLGTLLDEIEVHGKPYPARHDVQQGGYAQARLQRRKLEEMRHFFREFAKEVEEFVRRYHPDDLIILGTDENVAKFREFLPAGVADNVILTGPMQVGELTSEILVRIQPLLEAERERSTRQLLELLRERVRQEYLATAGFQSTLVALQEGKVDTLVIGQDQEREGARCTQCGFVFGKELERCPYDDSPANGGVDVVEEVVRLAEIQGAAIEFVSPGELEEVSGVGALLRF